MWAVLGGWVGNGGLSSQRGNDGNQNSNEGNGYTDNHGGAIVPNGGGYQCSYQHPSGNGSG